MLNPVLKLNQDYWKADAKKSSTRKGFGEILVEMATEDERAVALCADVTDSLNLTGFRSKFPRRFVEMGVAEQNMAAVASGLSAMGKVPFVASYAIFSPGRNWEQIRTTICYNNQPVKIVGSHGGVSVGPDGGSHQALEDVAIMRVLPRMTVLIPADYYQTKKAVKESLSINTPVYIRLSRPDLPILYSENSPYSSKKADLIWYPENIKATVLIIASGALIFEALKAVRDLEKEGIPAKILNLHTIKPLDKETILSHAMEAGAVVTVEDHQIIGGMGSAVSELLSQNTRTPLEFVGIKDEFGQSGTPEDLIKHYKIDKDGIKDAVKKVLKRRA